MPTYGPWIQDPDYTATVGGAPATTANTTAYVEQVEDGGTPPADPGRLDSAVAATTSDGFGATTDMIGRANNTAVLRAGYFFTGGAVGPYSTLYRASRTQPLWAFSAWANSTNYFRNTATLPAGATGIEYEGGESISTVLGAVLDYSIANTNVDDSNNGGPVSGMWTSTIVAYQNAQWEPTTRDRVVGWNGQTDRVGGSIMATYNWGEGGSSNSYSAQPPLTISEALYGNPKDGFITFSTEIQIQGAPRMASYSDNGAGYHIGIALSGPQVTYTLRPPRYRFVYPGGRPAYNRIVQRGSDGLGMTGGKRIIQNRTMQSTNRRGAAIR